MTSSLAQSPVRVPYVDLVGQHKPLKTEILRAVESVLDDGRFIFGPAVAEFEKQFAQLCGVRFAVGLNSGTDALILALRVLGVGPGDEVITAPNSFIASASAIAMVGAKPVFVDVTAEYNIDPTLLEMAITPRTKAIIPVHLTGRSADMTPILEISQKHGIPIVEDAAQSVIAEYRGRRVGSMGAIGCFSLHPLKTLNACGDGGVATTNDPVIAERLTILRNIGLKSRDDCVEYSGNSRLDTIQAAILLVKLKYLGAWTEGRRANAAFYREALAGIPQIQVPTEHEYEKPSYHTFVIQADRRDELRRHLQSRGVETAVHYPIPIHLHKASADLHLGPGSFPVTERQAARILSLPVYPELSSQQLQAVADGIRSFYV